MSKLTANQHYVWQYHLRAWATPKKLWCKRSDQLEPFSTTPRNVASERYFYEFRDLRPVDLAYIEQLMHLRFFVNRRQLKGSGRCLFPTVSRDRRVTALT